MAVQNDVTIWEDRINRSSKIREKKRKEVMGYIGLYKSNQWSGVQTTLKTKPVTNLVFSHIKSQLPILYFQNPKWFVTPKGKQKKAWIENAELAQYYLNYYVQENMRIPLKRQMRFAILDAFFWFGVIKTGYVPQIEIIGNYKKANRTIDGIEQQVYLNDANEVVDPRENVVSEKFVSRRRSPASMIFDMEAESCFEDGNYIIEEINVPLEIVKKDKKYSNTENLVASYMLKAGKEDKLSDRDYLEGIQSDIERVILYEIYDIQNDELVTIAKGHEKALRKDNMPSGIDGHPYSFLVFNDIPDEIYPLSDIRVQKSPQECYNKATGMIFEHAGKGARKYAYTEGTFPSEDDLENAKSSEDLSFFKVRELPLEKVLAILPTPTNDPAVDKMAAMSLNNFREAGGSTEQDRGVVERRKTAFEASKMTQANDVRKQDRKSQVEDWAADVGTKLLQSMQANLTIQDAIEISGKDNNGKIVKEWKEITKESIKGQMNVGVEVGSMTPKLPEYEREDFFAFLQAMSMIPPEQMQIYFKFEGLLKAVPRMFPAIEDLDLLNSDEEIKFNKTQILEKQKIQMMIENNKSKKGGMNNNGEGV